MNIPPVQITQHELAEIADHEKEAAWRMKRVDELKANVKAMLIAKIPIEPGRFDARLKTRISRHVPWKTLVMEKLGPDVANWFRKLYPPQPFSEVMVVEHAIPPLWKGKEQAWHRTNWRQGISRFQAAVKRVSYRSRS